MKKIIYIALTIFIIAIVAFGMLHLYNYSKSFKSIETNKFKTSGGRYCETMPISIDKDSKPTGFCLICPSGIACFKN